MSVLVFEDVPEGAELPAFPLPLTMQRLVMEVGANRDLAPLHHDRDIARATGAPDAYANTMLIQAMFEATVREWMGCGGRLRKLGFSMRSFALAGTTLTGHGRVVGRRADEGGGFIDLEVWTDADGKQTAVGTATVWLPGGEQGSR